MAPETSCYVGASKFDADLNSAIRRGGYLTGCEEHEHIKCAGHESGSCGSDTRIGRGLGVTKGLTKGVMTGYVK